MNHVPLRRVSVSMASLLALSAAPACAPAEGRPQAGAEDSSDTGQMAMNQLTPDEAREGFELLFDGQTLDLWRGYRMDDAPRGWTASDGALTYTPGGEGGDLITRSTYTDFDLRLEWKVGPAGNSGIFFGIIEDPPRSYESGPEMQVLDNAGHADGRNPLTSAGSNYGLYAPSSDLTRPLGEWNEARIVRRGNRVEHWLNGTRVVEYEIGSEEWRALVAGSKFAEWADYGIHHEGHIGLQDHGDRVWYRNVRIRRF